MAEEQRALTVRVVRAASVRREDMLVADVDDALLRVLYTLMVRLRAFELRVAELVGAGKVSGTQFAAGLEAVAIGACTALRNEDFLVSTERPHGHLLAKGVEPRFIFAELLTASGGLSAGKAGPRWLADPNHGVLGSYVGGGGLPVAVGAALSCRTRRTEQVVLAMVDEPAVASGAFAESAMLARRWRLPVVFLHERVEQGESGPFLADSAPGLGVPATAVDGADPVVVFRAVSEAVGRARAGDGPGLVEAPVRWPRDESSGDSSLADPIVRLAERLRGFGLLTGDEERDIDQRATDEISDALEWAQASPQPDPVQAFREVYGRPIDRLYPLVNGSRRG